MRRINDNYGALLLLFTKGEARSVIDNLLVEKEYYLSEDSLSFGVIVYDTEDDNFSIALHRKNIYGQYKSLTFQTDIPSIGKARNALSDLMENYEDNGRINSTSICGVDLFSQVADESQISPIYRKLKNDEFYSSAKCVFEEFAKYFIDADNNFVDQFQSINGIDSRVWEMFLLCFLREEGFTMDKTKAVPDFIADKLGYRIAIEAVTVGRKENKDENTFLNGSIDDLFSKLENEIPLAFGSALFSKWQKKYWEQEHVKNIPFIIAVEDFHEDMSMMWTFPAITSTLYGIRQELLSEDGNITLNTINGITLKKGNKEITPLFLDKNYENVSAVLLSATGTIPKFNRMGKQAGLGSPNLTFVQTMCCYNHDENAIIPDFAIRKIDENCHERWSDGVAIFHNPLAKHPLDPDMFPDVAHHFYKDGLIYSNMPEHFCMSSFLWNVKGDVGQFENKVQKFYGKYHNVKKMW